MIVMVMEMTSDFESFENDTMNETDNAIVGHMYEGDAGDLRSIQRRKTCDLSTLRTLIAAWLRCTPELYIDVPLKSLCSTLVLL